MEEDGMRSHLKAPALAIVGILMISACSSGATPTPSAASAAPPTTAPASASAAPPSTAASPSVAAVPTPEPAKDCARTTDAGAMQMWERSGGNKGMVDILVCDWNAAHPDKLINLSYIVHTDMVAKITQGI